MTGLVSVVIVNFNSGTFLTRCLISLSKQTYPAVEIIVVDNASSDGSVTYAEVFDNIDVIKNRANIGFAAAQNQGMMIAKGCYMMPLNFDVELDECYVAEMVKEIESSEKIGWVCGKHFSMTEEGVHLNTFYSTGHLLPSNRFPQHRGAGEIDDGQYDAPGIVFGAPGVAPLYRKEMLDDVAYQGQYFDETYFTWWEDLDLDWRANLRGWQCQYAPDALIYHIGTESASRSDWHLSMSIRNRWLMIATNEDIACFVRNLRSLFLYEVSLLIFILAHKRYRAYAMGLAGFLRRIPYMVRKRSWIMRNKLVKCSAIHFTT